MTVLKACYYALFTAVYDAVYVLTPWERDRRSVAWRAALALSVLEAIVVGSAMDWAEMLGWEPIFVTRVMSGALFFGLLGINYLVLLRHGRWEAYMDSFRAYPRRKQREIKWAARLAVVFLAIACGFTFLWVWHRTNPRWQNR